MWCMSEVTVIFHESISVWSFLISNPVKLSDMLPVGGNSYVTKSSFPDPSNKTQRQYEFWGQKDTPLFSVTKCFKIEDSIRENQLNYKDQITSNKQALSKSYKFSMHISRKYMNFRSQS